MSLSRRLSCALAALLVITFVAGSAEAGRYEQLTGWAAGGEEMRVVSATCFGSADAEQFAVDRTTPVARTTTAYSTPAGRHGSAVS